MTDDRRYRDRAIVLRGRILGEADRILTLLSFEHGKIEAVVKGVRKPRTKFAGLFEIASDVQIECLRGRSLDVVTEADLLHAYWPNLVTPECYAVTTAVLECVDTLCLVADPLPEVYLLLRNMLAAVARLPAPLAFIPRFELRLLALLGFGADFTACVRCGTMVTGHACFVDPDDGGAVCEGCGRGIAGLPNVGAAELAQLAALARAPEDPDPPLLRANGRIADLAHRFMLMQLGRRPRTETAMRALLELSAPLSDLPEDVAPS